METIYEIKTCKVRLRVTETELGTVRDPESALGILRSIYKDLDADQEHFTILCLNKAYKVTGFKVLFSGGQDEANVDLKVLFRNALLMGATALILAHNHPSGRVEASPEDITLTKKIMEASAMLGIKILDHVILGNGYYSFTEKGLI